MSVTDTLVALCTLAPNNFTYTLAPFLQLWRLTKYKPDFNFENFFLVLPLNTLVALQKNDAQRKASSRFEQFQFLFKHTHFSSPYIGLNDNKDSNSDNLSPPLKASLEILTFTLKT
uniref:Uncharacterized protein n=1 Tax=Glossina austeni TaxID=7395 RepID=A0A1A9VHX4_GLOAU